MADLERILSIQEQFGGPPDALIIPAIEGLMELGFTSMDSCQGHPNASNTEGKMTYPYIGFAFEPQATTTESHKQALGKLVDLYNIIVPDSQGIFLRHNEDTGYSFLRFAEGLSVKELNQPGDLLPKMQLNAMLFGLYCRAISIGDESAKRIADIIALKRLKDGDMSNEFAQWRRNALSEFNQELAVLRELLDTIQLS